ncbi:MAG: AI-2E family transporter [Methylobacteriaceae bacterium]|nr:AI-2E family transporter [Methylobacteriaceae bacterium]
MERSEFMRMVGATAGLAMVGMIVAGLYVLREVLMPLALATLLSFVLAPVVKALTRRRAPKGLAVPLVVIAAFAGLFALGSVFAGQVGQLAADLPAYQTTLKEKLKTLRGAATSSSSLGKASEMLQDLARELDADEVKPPAQRPAAPTLETRRGPDGALLPIPVQVHEQKGAIAALAAMIAPLVHPLATTAMIVIFVIFILAQREDLRNRLIKLAGSRDLHRTTAALDDAAHRLSKMFAAQLALNSAFGVIIGVGLWLIGLPNPLLWGVLAGVLRFVPYIGAFISAAFPAILAVAVDPGWTMLIWVLALFLVVEPLVGHVAEPLLVGHTTGLSPVAVVVAATFWTWLWGPVGLVLATPLTICLVVMGKHIEGLRFIDTLLGDQPALSAPELFYQRMLAGDPIEATAQVETYADDNRLLDYYDDVAMSGLRLAQRDLDRSMLDPARVRRVRASVQELFAGFDDDEAPARAAADAADGKRPLLRLKPDDLDESWRAPTPILVIGGRTPLDEAAAIPMADAFNRAGLGAKVLPAETLQAAGLARLETTGVRMIVLSFLDDSSESAMRFAVRRLRVKAPQARIVLAIWADPDETIDRAHLKAATQADLIALSVREAHQDATLAAVTGGLHLDDLDALGPAATQRADPPKAAAS